MTSQWALMGKLNEENRLPPKAEEPEASDVRMPSGATPSAVNDFCFGLSEFGKKDPELARLAEGMAWPERAGWRIYKKEADWLEDYPDLRDDPRFKLLLIALMRRPKATLQLLAAETGVPHAARSPAGSPASPACSRPLSCSAPAWVPSSMRTTRAVTAERWGLGMEDVVAAHHSYLESLVAAAVEDGSIASNRVAASNSRTRARRRRAAERSNAQEGPNVSARVGSWGTGTGPYLRAVLVRMLRETG